MARQRSDLLTVQALRGAAVLPMVAFHAINAWSEHVPGRNAIPLNRISWGIPAARMVAGSVALGARLAPGGESCR